MNSLQRSTTYVRRVLVLLAFAAGTTVVLLWLAGRFAPKVPTTAPETRTAPRPAGRVVAARLISLPRVESAVGTIRAVHEISIGSKLLARVTEVKLRAGQKVHTGDVLLRLDDGDLRAKLAQAKEAAISADAAHSQAVVNERRYGDLLKQNATSREDYEKMATAKRTTEAELRRANEIVNEVQATLDWATIRAPIDGTVIDKKVDVGDLVTPGQPLLTLFDPKRMQLVASVRESLAQRLEVGQSIGVDIEGMAKECSGTITEIVPEAQAASRAFQVKVTGPCPPGIYTGMFGRILIPLAQEQILVIPRKSVAKVGQLELIDVMEADAPRRRAIRTGRILGDDVEVLSGLEAGEKVLVPANAEVAQGASRG